MESFQAAAQGERTQRDHGSPIKLRKQGWELKEAKVPGICGKEQQRGESPWRGQSHLESSGYVCSKGLP